MDSPGCALGVVGFNLGLLGSLEFTLLVDVFTRMRPRGPRVHLRSLGSRGCALEVVWFIRGRWIHSGELRGSSGSFGVVRFNLGHALVVAGFIRDPTWGSFGVLGFTRVRPRYFRVHSGTLMVRGCGS